MPNSQPQEIMIRKASVAKEIPREQGYRYGLAVTSQFYFCGLPLRLDSYSRCAFQCGYCFAHARGGAHRDISAKVYQADRLARRFENIQNGHIRGSVDELLAQRQPIHFGGMSDPFSSLEILYKASLANLKVLADNLHPTVISTKSDMLITDEYLSVLQRGKFIVQVSLSSLDDRVISQVDRGAAGPKRLEKMLKLLADAGIPTTCRIQPLLPTLEHHAFDVIEMCSKNTVRHVAVEHLKLGIEKNWSGTQELNQVLGIELPKYFQQNYAVRVGREWILDVNMRLEHMDSLRKATHRAGMTFGAADNDLLLLSDGGCCCSGADHIPGFENYFRYNYLEAARLGLESGVFDYNLLSKTWFPSGSIAEFVNSNSRLPLVHGKGVGVQAYIEANWNGATNGMAPSSLFGIEDSGMKDDSGLIIYQIKQEVRDLVLSSQPIQH